MNETTNNASILSVHADASPNTFRVSLIWQGNHDIADFDLERFGKVLSLRDETENTGWAIIERPFRTVIAHTLPGWAINHTDSGRERRPQFPAIAMASLERYAGNDLRLQDSRTFAASGLTLLCRWLWQS